MAMSPEELNTRLLQTLTDLNRKLSSGAASLGGSGAGGGTHGSGGGDSGSRTSNQQKTQQQLLREQNELLEELNETYLDVMKATNAGKIKEAHQRQREYDALREALGDVVTELHDWSENEAAARQREQEAADNAAKIQNIKASGEIQSSMGKLTRVYSELIAAPHDDWQAFDKYSLSMNKSIASSSSMLSGMIEASSSGLQNEAYDRYIQNMISAAKSVEQFQDKIQDLANEGITDLTAHNLTEILKDLTSEARIFEQVSKDSNGKIIETIESLWQLKEAGDNIGEAGEAVLKLAKENGFIDEHTGAILASNEEIENHTKSIKRGIIEMQRQAVAQVTLAKFTQNLSEKFGDLGAVLSGQKGSWGAISIGMGIFAANLGAAIDQLRIAADVGMLMGGEGILGSFGELKKAQFQLGLSFEETAKIFQENRRLAFTAGGSSVRAFSDAINDGQRSLIELGMSNDEAAKSAVDFAQNAVKAGIDIREAKDFKKVLKSQSDAYGRLKLLTGASASEFKALNEELYNSQSVQEQLNGLGNQERIDRMNSMMSLREDFVKLGLSAQSANKALISIQDLGKQKLAERFTQAAKVQQMAGLLGMKNGAQLAAIARKGTRATAEERKILMEGMVDLRKRADQKRLGSYGEENVIQALEAQLSGPLQTMYESAVEASKTTDALGDIAKSGIGKQTVDKDIKLPPWAASLVEIESSTKQILGDPILKALGGILLAAGGILTLNRQLSVIGSYVKAIAAKTVGDIGGVGGKKEALKTAGKRIGGGLALAGGGYLLDSLADTETDKDGNKSKTGKAASIGSTALTGASMGMMFGPWGAAIGGAIGLGVGAYQELSDGDNKKDKKPEDKKPEVSASGTSSNAMNNTSAVAGIAATAGTASGVTSSYSAGSANPKSIYSVQPGGSPATSKTITPIGSSTSSSSSESNSEVNAQIVKLSTDTIQKLGAYLVSINETETKALNIEQQQLDMLVSLVGSNDEALREAKSLPPIPGQTKMFARGSRYEYIN